MMAAIVDGATSHAFCIACARCDTSFNPSSNDIAPAATSAENSPSEWPATISGANSSPIVFANITECKNTAGWVTLVCFKSSGVPSNIKSVILKPKISFAFSNISRASALFSYRSLPIPTNCAPCPGNTNAFIFFSYCFFKLWVSACKVTNFCLDFIVFNHKNATFAYISIYSRIIF